MLKHEILTVLEEMGGEVVDPDGFAARKIYERCSHAQEGTYGYSMFSGLTAELEDEGKLYRDQPSLKRTTRIALVKPGVRPAYKDIRVVMEKASRGIAETVESTISTMLDAHVAAAVEEQRPAIRAEAEAEFKDLIDEKDREIARLQARLRDAIAEPATLREQVRVLKQQHEEKDEQLRISRHNEQEWRRRASRARTEAVKEVEHKVRDLLRPEQKRQLEGLMREVPGTR